VSTSPTPTLTQLTPWTPWYGVVPGPLSPTPPPPPPRLHIINRSAESEEVDVQNSRLNVSWARADHSLSVLTKLLW